VVDGESVDDEGDEVTCDCERCESAHLQGFCGVAGLTFTLPVRISTWSVASRLEQTVFYLLCAQANSASYPQRDGK